MPTRWAWLRSPLHRATVVTVALALSHTPSLRYSDPPTHTCCSPPSPSHATCPQWLHPGSSRIVTEFLLAIKAELGLEAANETLTPPRHYQPLPADALATASCLPAVHRAIEAAERGSAANAAHSLLAIGQALLQCNDSRLARRAARAVTLASRLWSAKATESSSESQQPSFHAAIATAMAHPALHNYERAAAAWLMHAATACEAAQRHWWLHMQWSSLHMVRDLGGGGSGATEHLAGQLAEWSVVAAGRQLEVDDSMAVTTPQQSLQWLTSEEDREFVGAALRQR